MLGAAPIISVVDENDDFYSVDVVVRALMPELSPVTE